MHTGNPAASVAVGTQYINLERLFVLLGNGVNLFFVISGFCILLVLQRTDWTSPGRGYGRFVFRRWRRLSPAFYVATAVSAAFVVALERYWPIRAVLFHLAWLPDLKLELAAPFWSLQTEWEFYLFTPLLLLAARKVRLAAAILLVGAITIGLRAYTFAQPDGISAPLLAHLPGRFLEFGWGMLALVWIESGHRSLRAVAGVRGVLIGFLTAYLGRAMMTTEAAAYFGTASSLIKAFAEPVMTLGFAVILVSVVTSHSVVSSLLETPPLQRIGQWSYSLYLLHWWPSILIGGWMKDHLGQTVAAHYAALSVLLILLLPAAWLLYRLCEEPMLRRSAVALPLPRGRTEA